MPLVSSVEAWNKRVEAINDSQKQDMKLLTIEHVKTLKERVDKLEKLVERLEAKVEKIENEGV